MHFGGRIQRTDPHIPSTYHFDENSVTYTNKDKARMAFLAYCALCILESSRECILFMDATDKDVCLSRSLVEASVKCITRTTIEEVVFRNILYKPLTLKKIHVKDYMERQIERLSNVVKPALLFAAYTFFLSGSDDFSSSLLLSLNGFLMSFALTSVVEISGDRTTAAIARTMYVATLILFTSLDEWSDRLEVI